MMDASTIKSYIQTKTIPHFLIFTGSEWVIQRIYIDKISEVLGIEKRYVDSISDIYGSLRTRSIFDENRLYVIRDDKEIIHNEKIQEQLQQGLLKDNYLILLLTSPDKRTKFYKAYKDDLCEFQPLKPQILRKYIQKELPLSDKAAEKLMEVCEYDYGRCLLEIDKIKHHAKATQAEDMPNNVFELLLFDGTIYQPPKDAIFDFVDAILDRKAACFDLYEQCKAVGEATLVMLSVLYTNAKAVLQVQSCHNNDIAKSTGLTAWQINNARKHLNKYKIGELVKLLRLIRECEKGIKTGVYEEQFVMDYILVKIL